MTWVRALNGQLVNLNRVIGIAVESTRKEHRVTCWGDRSTFLLYQGTKEQCEKVMDQIGYDLDVWDINKEE